MFKFLTKQFLYGRVYLYLKERLSGILFLIISIFVIVYFHSEYLKYLELKDKIKDDYIGVSFIIKNVLILIVAIAYYYFFFILQRNKKNPVKDKENKKEVQTSTSNNQEMVKSLDEFLEDDEFRK